MGPSDALPTPPLPHRSRGRKGPPVVLIHGFAADRLAWAGMMPRLAKLRRTVAFDLPGHGEAVEWPGTPDASVAAKAVIASLDALHIGRAVLVGHSLGGAVAGIVGLMRPDLVERLVLLAPGGFGPEMNVRLLKRLAFAEDELELAIVLEQLFGPTSAIPDALAKRILSARKDAALRASHRAIVGAISRGDGQGTLPLDELAAAPFPISLAWGLEDAVLPVRQAFEAPATMARHLIPKAGHMLHWEAEDLVLRIIAQAVAGHLEETAIRP